MAYVDFPTDLKGQKERKAFWLSEDGLKLIAGWRRNGIATTKIIDDYIGVGRTTFFRCWLKENDNLRKALNTGKDTADMAVEEALLKRACGYDYYEETYELVEGELVLVRRMRRHMPPDTKAILSWLYNRLPSRYEVVSHCYFNLCFLDD